MITKFKIFENSRYDYIIDEVTYLMKNHFNVDVNFKITGELPYQLIILFPNNITTKEPWFFKVLQVIRRYGFIVDIEKNIMRLRRIKRYEGEIQEKIILKMITNFKSFNESADNEMAVTIVISEDYMDKYSKDKWLKDNKELIKKYLGSYFSSIEAIIDPKDFDEIAKTDGVVDVYPNDDPMEAKPEPEPKPKKEKPKTSDTVMVGVDKDGNVSIGGQIIGQLPPDHPMRNDINRDYQPPANNNPPGIYNNPTRKIMLDGVTFKVEKYKKGTDEWLDEYNPKFVITIWDEDGGLYDADFPMWLFPELDKLDLDGIMEGYLLYNGDMTKKEIIKAFEDIGFKYNY